MLSPLRGRTARLCDRLLQIFPGGITVRLNRLDDQKAGNLYAAQALHQGRYRYVLEHHIRTDACSRLEAAPSNFAASLPTRESDLAQQTTKDPYVLDFLALEGDAKKRQLEVDWIIDTLRELGRVSRPWAGRCISTSTGMTCTGTCSSYTSSSSATW